MFTHLLTQPPASFHLLTLLCLGFDLLMLRASASLASAIELICLISTLAAPGMGSGPPGRCSFSRSATRPFFATPVYVLVPFSVADLVHDRLVLG